MSDDSIDLTDAEIRLFANERIAYDRSEETPFTHAAKMSRNLIAANDVIRDLRTSLLAISVTSEEPGIRRVADAALARFQTNPEGKPGA
jgi:hypothetical protein